MDDWFSAVAGMDEIRFTTAGDSTATDYTADITFRNMVRYLGPLPIPALKRVGERALKVS